MLVVGNKHDGVSHKPPLQQQIDLLFSYPRETFDLAQDWRSVLNTSEDGFSDLFRTAYACEKMKVDSSKLL